MVAKKPNKPNSPGLDAALAHLNKEYGKGAIMRLGDTITGEPVPVISTGSVGLNHALGVGGFPKGRVIEIYGPEGSGKTTMALSAAAYCQADGGTVAFIDAEHALDPEFARGCGVDTDALLISQPDNGEMGLETADVLLRSGGVDLIIVDSVAALVPRAEIDGSMGDSHIGLQARMMSQALRKLTAGMTAGTSATIIFINQLREKVGVVFGSPEVTSGGKALKFYASVRLDVRRIETLKTGTPPAAYGSRVRIKVVKNKVGPPFKLAEMNIIFGRGIDQVGELFDHGLAAGIIIKTGNSYSFNTVPLGVGVAKARQYLYENQEALAALRAAVTLAMVEGMTAPAAAPSQDIPVPTAGGKAPLGELLG